MTVKTIPYWRQGPAWGEPGHEPWQKTTYQTNPQDRWGWWNDSSVTDEDIWKTSPEYRASRDFELAINRIPDVGRMAGLFMPGALTVDGFKTPWWAEEQKPLPNPKDYLL